MSVKSPISQERGGAFVSCLSAYTINRSITMLHLASFRKGWENENLAKFILSKFSFVANPSTVADDIGSDFLCTLFRIERENNKDYLLPLNAFAIQIKSNTDDIDVCAFSKGFGQKRHEPKRWFCLPYTLTQTFTQVSNRNSACAAIASFSF